MSIREYRESEYMEEKAMSMRIHGIKEGYDKSRTINFKRVTHRDHYSFR